MERGRNAPAAADEEVRGQLAAPTVVNDKVAWWIGHNDLNGARSGIVDDVWMRAYGGVHTEDAFINPSVRQKTLTVTYTLEVRLVERVIRLRVGGEVMQMREPTWMERELELPGGARVHVYEAGPAGGAPVVLLHGGGIDSARLSWGPTLEMLASEGFRVLAPDCPGYGSSPPLPGRFTLSRWTELLSAVFDAAGLARAAVVGVSMGGGAGLGLALASPWRVERLCLVGAYGLQRGAPLHRSSWLLVRLPGLAPLTGAALGASRAALRSNLRGILRNPAALTEELLDQVAEAARHPTALRVFSDFQRDEIRWGGLRTNFVERLGELRMPVLFVHGSDDIGVPVEEVRAAAARVPRARLEVFEGAGHWTQRDEPERFHGVLRAFLRDERS